MDEETPAEKTAALDEPPVLVELGSVTEVTLGSSCNDTRDMKRDYY